MSLAKLRANGCDSVMGRSHVGADWEYVVYESERVRVIDGLSGIFAHNFESTWSDDDQSVEIYSPDQFSDDWKSESGCDDDPLEDDKDAEAAIVCDLSDYDY
jgi:hypothetical protein